MQSKNLIGVLPNKKFNLFFYKYQIIKFFNLSTLYIINNV